MDTGRSDQLAERAAGVPTAVEALRGLVLEGARSELGPVVDAGFFAELRRQLLDRD